MEIIGDFVLVSFELLRPGSRRKRYSRPYGPTMPGGKQYIRACEELEKIGFHREFRDENACEWSGRLPPNTFGRVVQPRMGAKIHIQDDMMEEVNRAFQKCGLRAYVFVACVKSFRWGVGGVS